MIISWSLIPLVNIRGTGRSQLFQLLNQMTGLCDGAGVAQRSLAGNTKVKFKRRIQAVA